MSVIIYGTRGYGRVEAHEGEHAETRFFHIWFAPLIPTGSVWITRTGGDGPFGHAIKLHGKSIVAGYLRVWGPIVALGTLGAGLSGSLGSLVAAAIAVSLTAWSWTWRGLRSDAARRRSDFNFVAFGTRCEPARMSPALRAGLRRDLEQRWAERSPDRSPNDVANHGTTSAAEAVVAYGLLRLAGIERGRAGRTEDAEADRILAGTYAPTETRDGPYRVTQTQTADASAAPSLASLVADRAQARAVASPVVTPSLADGVRAATRRSRRQLAGLVVMTFMALGGAGLFAVGNQPTLDIGLKELRATTPPMGRMVRLTCDHVEGPLWEEVSDRGRVTSRIAICELGKYLVAIQIGKDETAPARLIEGKLREVNDRAVWVRDGLRKEAAIDARALEVFIDTTTTRREEQVMGGIGLAIAVATPVLWLLWFRARRRRRALVATSS